MISNYKLGRRFQGIPAGVPDLRAHAIAAMVAPAQLPFDRFSRGPLLLDMGGNDTAGDCGEAGLANAIRVQAALAGYQVDIPTARTIALYSITTGYVPGNPATDTGTVLVALLAWQLAHGFDTGGQTPYAGLWATLEPGDLNLLRVVMARMGCGYLGVNLSMADQIMPVWDTISPAAAGDPTPGSWGKHCLLSLAYTGTDDTDLVTLGTWGKPGQVGPGQTATWRWVRRAMEEAHAIVHPQMIGPSYQNFYGLNQDNLAADCASYAAAA